MAEGDPLYRAYLLRCWQEGQAAPDGEPGWRFSVEEVLYRRRRWGFTGLESLLGFLQAELCWAICDSTEIEPFDGSKEFDSLATKSYYDKKGGTQMEFKDYLRFANENQLCHLSTTEGDQPRVRVIRMWFANEEGFYFCGLAPKNVWKQIEANPKVEVCFFNHAPDPGNWRVLRVTGEAEFLDNLDLKKKVLEDRPFYKQFGSGKPNDPTYPVMRIAHGEAWFWTTEYILREAEAERIRF